MLVVTSYLREALLASNFTQRLIAEYVRRTPTSVGILERLRELTRAETRGARPGRPRPLEEDIAATLVIEDTR